jgi:ankyrin repeat protein
MQACIDGNIDQVSDLIENTKVDINSHDVEWPFNTALLHALDNGHTVLAKYLFDQGADTTLKSAANQGVNPH